METVSESVYSQLNYIELQKISSGLENANKFLNVIVWAFFLIVAVIIAWRLWLLIKRTLRNYIQFPF